jgi:predicted metal-binding protein
MDNTDLAKYCKFGLEHGVTDAKIIHPGTVITAPWVRWKCRYGCAGYGERYTCPPDSPTHDQTRQMLDCYNRAILFHQEQPASPERSKTGKDFLNKMIELEGEIFKDGYYKAFVFLAGPCHLCKECAKSKDLPCNFGMKARPCMESSGIDVFQTARNNGFDIVTLREKSETRNIFCLMLVD